MLSIRTEWTHITRARMDESVPDHFVLALESLSTLCTRAAGHRAVVRSRLGVYIRMGAVTVSMAYIIIWLNKERGNVLK